MGAERFPPVRELLPHREPMLFLREVLKMEDDSLVATAAIPSGCPLVDGGRAPSFLGLEAAAQAAAALEALRRRATDPGPRVGYLVSVRDAHFHAGHLPTDRPLTVTVRASGSVPPLAVYEVTVEVDGAPAVAGRISTYVLSAGS